jgi:outer membrane biogenesis lipoprotein LolB
MTLAGKILFAAAATALLAGCGALNNLTGQTDNTVLPGQREDAIPGRTQFPERQDVAVGSPSGSGSASSVGSASPSNETYCGPDDPDCRPPGSGDTFSDPQ